MRDSREHWNRQAPIYASDDGHRRFGRFIDLYEEAMRDLDRRYAEDPCVVATSGRLLLVARRPE